jgi:hypothetical protein
MDKVLVMIFEAPEVEIPTQNPGPSWILLFIVVDRIPPRKRIEVEPSAASARDSRKMSIV